MDSTPEPPAASSRLPRFAGVLLPGGRARLITEIFAGVTLAALALPLNIGYAEAAGLPAIVGINAAILPVIAFALFSGSRNLVTGPDATIAAVLLDFEAVTDIDPTASEALEEAISLLHERDKTIGITRASTRVLTLLDLYGLSGPAGVDHVFTSNREALAAYLADGSGPQAS